MDAKTKDLVNKGYIIIFKKDGSEEGFRANIFPTHPYVTFTDSYGQMIEGTGYEFCTEELRGDIKALQEAAQEFIKSKGWYIVE